jgi:hypothetical protein
MYNKDHIDKEAEREALALRKQGYKNNHNNSRTRQADNYNKNKFDKLFRD